MSPIPGEPHERRADELVTKDGRKVKVKVPGLAPRAEPKTGERGPEEPPRDDPRPPVNPYVPGV